MKPLPALAILLAACACVVECSHHPEEARTSSQPKIETIAPKGEVRFPFAFEWKSTGAGADAIYRLIVYDAAERELFERDMRVERYETPADLQSVFSSARRFLWRAAVVDATGGVVAETPLVECTVR